MMDNLYTLAIASGSIGALALSAALGAFIARHHAQNQFDMRMQKFLQKQARFDLPALKARHQTLDAQVIQFRHPEQPPIKMHKR